MRRLWLGVRMGLSSEFFSFLFCACVPGADVFCNSVMNFLGYDYRKERTRVEVGGYEDDTFS